MTQALHAEYALGVERDPYEILGVSRTASLAEIKRAWRARAREVHPDRNAAADAEEQFKEVQAAWETLSDVHKRAGWHAEKDPAARGVPRAFYERFEDAVERAQTLVFGLYLPRYLGAWRGLGAEAVARFANDLLEGRLVPSGAFSRRGKHRADRWAARVDVVVDYAPWIHRIDAHAYVGGGWRLILYPQAYWHAGVREAADLDTAVANDMASQVIAILGASIPGWTLRKGPDGIPEARALDDAAVRERWRDRLVWMGLAAIAAVFVTWALFAP